MSIAGETVLGAVFDDGVGLQRPGHPISEIADEHRHNELPLSTLLNGSVKLASLKFLDYVPIPQIEIQVHTA